MTSRPQAQDSTHPQRSDGVLRELGFSVFALFVEVDVGRFSLVPLIIPRRIKYTLRPYPQSLHHGVPANFPQDACVIATRINQHPGPTYSLKAPY
ncbi:hypothetical protein ONZ45_g13923 [Pleurotus djamor]|nr:hypothetical protein ONZ45_g13923 [Pleurotus djamor]